MYIEKEVLYTYYINIGVYTHTQIHTHTYICTLTREWDNESSISGYYSSEMYSGLPRMKREFGDKKTS